MGLGETITRFFSRLFRKERYPLYETCAACGDRVYLPFFCDYCHRYYCDRHRLPFDHNCTNIEEWKKRRI